MGDKTTDVIRMFGVLPSQGADPIPVRLAETPAGGGMIETNKIRMVGVLPSQGADPIPVSFVVGAGVCRIKTGTYTGDGTIGKAITGVGFEPKYLHIWEHPLSEEVSGHYEKLDQGWGDYAYSGQNSSVNDTYADRIKSLDADGFTVSDGGSNVNPNRNGTVYDYLALG